MRCWTAIDCAEYGGNGGIFRAVIVLRHETILKSVFRFGFQGFGREHFGEFAGGVHFAHNVCAADKFAVDVQLRNCRPIRVFFYALPDIRIGEDIHGDEICNAAPFENIHRKRRKTALRKIRRPFHVQHDRIVADLFKNFIFNFHRRILAYCRAIAYNCEMRFLLILILALTAPATAADKINTLAIIVNNDGITRLEIERLADKLMQRADSAGEPLDEAAARRRAADSLIFRALQLQRARSLGVQIPDAMVEQRLTGLRERLNVSDNAALRGAVRDNFGLSWDDFYRGLLEDLQIEAIFYREVFGKTDVYEKDVETFLKTESGLFGEREYRLRHLRIDGGENAAAKIEGLRKQILETGASFALLARVHSSADDAEENGDLGWKTLNQLPAAFTPEILKMTPGDVSEPIETARGFHLLQLLDVRGGGAGDSVSQVHLSHIFLDLNEEELANDLHSRLSAGKIFRRWRNVILATKKVRTKTALSAGFRSADCPIISPRCWIWKRAK